MRIIHVIPSLAKGGAERLTIDICNALSHLGHQVLLLRMKELNEYSYIPFDFETKVISSKVIPSLSGKATIDLKEWESIIENFKPDVIHSHLFLAEVLSRERPIKKIKYFTHLHDNMPQFANFKLHQMRNKVGITNFYEKYRLIKKYKQCDNTFLAISNDALKYFENALPAILSKRVILLHNAIEFARFSSEKKVGEDLKTKFNLVSVGSLVPKKNQQFLVDVMQHIIKEIPHAHLDILGDGPDMKMLQDKVAANKLDKYITLHGNVNNVEQFLSESNMYLHAATYEPFGLVLLEAMAAGLPCICLDGKGNRDIIENGKNGFILHDNDAKAFANQVILLYKNQQQLMDMGTYAHTYAAQFDIAIYAKKLLHLYQ